MLNKVAKVSVVESPKLAIRFSDGAGGVHDFSGILDKPGPMSEPLRDPMFFSRVFVEDGALTWPNGFDVCPDWLRMEMEKAGELTWGEAA